MKVTLISFLILVGVSACQSDSPPLLENIDWIHGSANCAENNDPPLQVLKYYDATWIFRQNKCIHYEAPFMFLFVGSERALLMDTGAPYANRDFPLEKTVREIIGSEKELVVAHTHSHGDHHAADGQFADKPNTTVVGLSPEEVAKFFQLRSWTEGSSTYELGGRTVEIIPIPGHDKVSIALYDERSKLLLSGDTFYPGRLYVRDWQAFRNSIRRLSEFCTHHEVQYLVGNHIEMSMAFGQDYPVGTTYQPDEHPLPLRVQDLFALRDSLTALGDIPAKKVYREFIVEPVN